MYYFAISMIKLTLGGCNFKIGIYFTNLFMQYSLVSGFGSLNGY